MQDGKNPIVSIVVCTYNGEAFIRQQLDSLINQTYPSLEILVSDDGSTDRTVLIVRDYMQKDSRIHLHVNPKNLGYNRNFEQALLRASGSLIAVCDQDDVWSLN